MWKLSLLLILVGTFSLKTHALANRAPDKNVILATPVDTSYQIIDAPDNTFGYEIRIGSKLFIRQKSIPGLRGNKGFERKKDAEKVAQLVILKLRKGIMPPTIERKDLDSLKVKY